MRLKGPRSDTATAVHYSFHLRNLQHGREVALSGLVLTTLLAFFPFIKTRLGASPDKISAYRFHEIRDFSSGVLQLNVEIGLLNL